MLQRRVSETGVVFYVSTLLLRAGVPHGFSTRIGGVSPRPFDTLNLGNPAGSAIQDEWPRIHENYRRFQLAVGLNDRQRCWVHQVHGCEVVLLRPPDRFDSHTQADALVSDDPRRSLCVRTADCVPVLLASEDGRFVAAVHAGWRGILAGVVSGAVKQLQRLCDSRIVAAIGPCIGRDAYQVGPEVLQQFQRAFGAESPIEFDDSGRGRVDLRRAVEMQLIRSGVAADLIDTTDRCTFRDAQEFFSHRRDGSVTGRMAAIIGPRDS